MLDEGACENTVTPQNGINTTNDCIKEEISDEVAKMEELQLEGTAGASLDEKVIDSKSAEIKFDYIVIDNEEELKRSLQSIDETLKNDPILAVDCEGDSLSRDGKIQLISVATRAKAFLIDIEALKHAPFELGLRNILENENVRKLMFDCREDSDALFHQFKVKLDGVVDIQLLEVMRRPKESPARTPNRRCDRLHEAVKLKGLLNCVEEFIQDKEIVEFKERGSRKMGDWGKRPFEKELLHYSTVDVMSLFWLYDTLNPDEEEKKKLQTASKIYVDLKRSIPKRVFDRYEKNCYLPIDVLRDTGQTGFSYGFICCTKCSRKFPRDEFSTRQLKKHIQMCRTCKRVKQDIDNYNSRQRSFELREQYEYDHDYDSDDDDYW